MKNKKFLPHVSALIAMFIWGGSYVWSSQVFKVLQPGTTVLLRLIISSIFLILINLALHRPIKIARKDIGLFFVAATLEPFLYFIGESYGLMRVSPTICSAIVATIPLFVPFAAFFILRERISGWNILGLVVSFIGILFMLVNKNMQLTASLSGILFLFGAVIVAVCYGIALKKLTNRYHALTIVTVQNSIGILYFLFFVLLVERNQLGSLAQVDRYIVQILLLGILASSISYVLYTHAVAKLGVTRSNVYTNLIPIFTAFFSYFLIREQITGMKATGIAIVIFGLILSQLKFKTSTTP